MTETPLEYQTPPTPLNNPLKVPALLLIVCGAVTLGGIGLDFLSRLVGRGSGFTFTFGIHIGPPESTMCFNALSIPLTVVMMAGAVAMLRLRNRQLAMAGAVLAVVPLTAACCCIFTLPIGIWALVLLNRAEVKGLFQ